MPALLQPDEAQAPLTADWYAKREPVSRLTPDCVLRCRQSLPADTPSTASAGAGGGGRSVCPVHLTPCRKPSRSSSSPSADEPTGADASGRRGLLDALALAPQHQHQPRVGPIEIAYMKKAQAVKEGLARVWRAEGSRAAFRSGRVTQNAPQLERIRADTLGGPASLRRPRTPCVVASHSLLPASLAPAPAPAPPAPQSLATASLATDAASVLAYLKALGLADSQAAGLLRHIRLAETASTRPAHAIVRVERRRDTPGSADSLTLNHFARGNGWFVSCIDYDHFLVRPDVHVGDQVLELQHGYLEERQTAHTHTYPAGEETFLLHIRACPFLTWLNFGLNACPIIGGGGAGGAKVGVEAANSDSVSGQKMQPGVGVGVGVGACSGQDLGFTLARGRVVSVLDHSPAQLSGLRSDDRLIEVDRTCVVLLTDAQIVGLLRRQLSQRPSRSVRLGVMPQRVYDALHAVQQHFAVCPNKGFHLQAWAKNDMLGVR